MTATEYPIAVRFARPSTAPLSYRSRVWSFAAGAPVSGQAIVTRAAAGAAMIAPGGVITLRSGAAAPPGPDSPVTPTDTGELSGPLDKVAADDAPGPTDDMAAGIGR